jgi:hypothetical protein
MGEMHITLELRKGLAERLFTAAEVLEFVKQQTGRKPKLLKSPLEVFKAGYKEEGLI